MNSSFASNKSIMLYCIHKEYIHKDFEAYICSGNISNIGSLNVILLLMVTSVNTVNLDLLTVILIPNL